MAVCLVVLLVGIGTDQVLRRVAQRRIAAALACRMDASGLRAHLSGLLVVPRLLTGRLGTVVVDGSAAGPATAVGARRVRITLDDVRARPLSGGSVATAGGALDLTVPFAALALTGAGAGASQAPAPRLGSAGDQLTVTRDAPALGSQVTVLMDLRVDGAALLATPATVEVAGRQLPVDVVEPLLRGRDPALADQLSARRLPLPHLPAGIRASSVRATPDGVVLTAALAAQRLTSDRACGA